MKDVITGKTISSNSRVIEVIIDKGSSGFIKGSTVKRNSLKRDTIRVESMIYGPGVAVYEKIKDKIFFSKRRGLYLWKDEWGVENQLEERVVKGRGSFPYSFTRRYEAVELFRQFNNLQQSVSTKVDFELAKHMKYTFGLEFETSEGYIPENLCFRDGLIPLRDGSISGIEYSTVVLEGNTGLNMLSQQLDTLKNYTSYDKDCSLHIHLGGFPLDPDKIFGLYKLLFGLQQLPSFTRLLPPYTFTTRKYKSSGKDYCQTFMSNFKSFEEMYRWFTGQEYFGSLEQPHPNDLRREAKWRIPTRYFWVNFINLLCYKVNKTVEFRFLRPTFNKKKIILWLYIFNAILMYAEKYGKNVNSGISLEAILGDVYPTGIYDKLKLELLKLKLCTDCQSRKGDYIGELQDIEEELFPRNEII